MTKIITCMGNFPRWISHPSDIFLYIINILLILFDRISVIESQITIATWNLCLHEIKSHSLTMTNMQISVGFWWESSQDTLSESLLSPLKILFTVYCWVHFSPNKLWNVFDMKLFFLFFFFHLLLHFLLFALFFLRNLLFFISSNWLFRKSFCLPSCIKDVF